MELLPCCRTLLTFHAFALCTELGIIGVAISNMLYELRHPHPSATAVAVDRRKKEIVATSVSIVITFISFFLSALGASDIAGGIKMLSTHISAAGHAMSRLSSGVLSRSRRHTSSRDSSSDVKDSERSSQSHSHWSLSQNTDRQGSSATHGKAQ
jgi:hypothetical protein